MVNSSSTKMSLAINILIINYCLSHVNCSLFTVVVSLFVMLHSLSLTVCTNKYSSSFFYPVLLYLLSFFFFLTFIAYQTYNWPSHTFKNLSPIPSNLNLRFDLICHITQPIPECLSVNYSILYHWIFYKKKNSIFTLCLYLFISILHSMIVNVCRIVVVYRL